MTRWAKAVALGLTCVAFATGQAPPTHLPDVPTSPAGATDGPRVGEVIALRTAGQPNRQVKVLRVTRSGGEVLADLQDLATSIRYTVPARMLTANPQPAPTPTRAVARHTAPKWSLPPTLPPIASKAKEPTAPATLPAPPIKAPDKIVVVQPPVKRLPPVAPSSQVASRVTPNFLPKQPASSSLPPVNIPSVEPKVSLSRPAPRSPRILPDAALPKLSPGVPTALPTPMALETDPYHRDLVGALRPSVRQQAATALAECRYGWRPEIQAQLAKAATEDPSPAVRAHCVQLLSKLGFHEADYRTRLESWATSEEPQLRQAARDALARLTVKK